MTAPRFVSMTSGSAGADTIVCTLLHDVGDAFDPAYQYLPRPDLV